MPSIRDAAVRITEVDQWQRIRCYVFEVAIINLAESLFTFVDYVWGAQVRLICHLKPVSNAVKFSKVVRNSKKNGSAEAKVEEIGQTKCMCASVN